jgi:hypothetical protein
VKGIDQYLASMDRKVRKYGWGVVHVGGGEGEPPFAYTVGLPRHYDHPEFVIVGVPPAAARTLNALGDRVRDGEVFRAGDRPEFALPGYTTELIDLDWDESHRNLPVAWRLNGGPVDALQLVWPDGADRLPWDAGYSLPDKAQPLWGRRGCTPSRD